MKRIEHIFFVMLGGLLLLACTAKSAPAQDINPNKPPVQPGERRFPPITPGSILEGPKIGDREAIAISGQIRWRKEYGLPSIDGGMTPDRASNCYAMRIHATVQEGAPGTFGQAEVVGYALYQQNEPIEENGFYVCNYWIKSPSYALPRNQPIMLMPFMGPYGNPDLNYALTRGVWYGGSQSVPPPGYQRVVAGGREVTLTDSAPRATVNFEVVYNPIPQGPR